MGLLFKNNAETTLSGGINDSVTTISVASAAVFPTPDANNVFFATIDDGTNIEVVKVTAISSNDLTVVRAQDNTSASAFSTGANIQLRLTAKVLDMGTASLTDLDGDTKIQVEESSDEDKIRFDTGGTERMVIDNAGKVGIGTSSPASPLHIKVGTNNNLEIEETGGDLRLLAINDARAANVPMEFAASRFEFLTGNIGIGTASASEKLTVDGNIANISGDMTVDVVGSIVLDSDAGEISFQDDGTEIGKIFSSSTDFAFEAGVQDKDILFRGNDGGTGITALTLDMSDAGRAMFNGSVDIGGTSITRTGDLTLDVSGDIILDAGGEHIRFYDDGNEWGNIESGSSNFNLTASVQDKDFVFLGNDGGSGIIAARIDMSDAGALICNGNITAFGSTSDIRLKENVEVIPDALDKVKQLKGITFNYKKDGKKSTGLIAQDLEKVLPEAVYETSDVDDEDKHLAIRYGNTVGLLVEAIKEQQEQIETLTAKVKELEGK